MLMNLVRRAVRCLASHRIGLSYALGLVVSFTPPLHAEDFSGQRAYAILSTMVRDIGPRPMGSPAEQRALAFATAKFAEYGCDTSYILPMTVADMTNTTSGVAVGISRGRTGRMIVIGGHMDSSGPDIPGANDDGSGSACVIELARVLAPRERQSTIVFCCFGGEEDGLRGSAHFVKNFPLIDSVALMLQIDMADGASYLELDPDASYQVSAPRWLPRAAFEIFYSELGFSNLRYVTHAATLNASTSGAAGSDHEPFLDMGIPAIDFTSDVSYPIHTPLDNLTTFDSSGLARSGLLVQRLAERFDAGVPSSNPEKYYLLQIGSRLIFVDYWVLWSIHVLTFLLAGLALTKVWHTRDRDSARPRWLPAKIILAVLILQAFIWMPETIMGDLRGYHYPWVNNFGGYVILALLSGAIGLWFSLRLLRRFRIRTDAFPYFVHAFALLGLITIGLLFANPEIALYPGSALLFFSLAVLVRHPIVKGALAVAAFYLPLHLIFMEYHGLFLREMSTAVLSHWWSILLVDAVYLAVFAFLSLPFIYGVAAVIRSTSRDPLWLRIFIRPVMLWLLIPALLVVCGVLFTRPVYDIHWQRSVDVEQEYVLGTDSCTITLSSGESLEGLHVALDGRDSVMQDCGNTSIRHLDRAPGADWVDVLAHVEETRDSSTTDSLKALLRTLKFHGSHRPLKLEIRYQSDMPFSSRSPWSTDVRDDDDVHSSKSTFLRWYAFPDSNLEVPIRFDLKPGQRVTEKIKLVYAQLALPAKIERELTTVEMRTIATRVDTLVAR
jgi:hypothetical protein